MHKLTNRKLFLVVTLLSFLPIIYSFYAQYYLYQDPCPLCIAQRVILTIIGICGLFGLLFSNNNIVSRIISLIMTGFAIFGAKVAYHHLWLQNLPEDQQPLSCGMPLEIMYKRLPLDGFLKYILAGDGECAKITWRIFGISAPTMSMLLFITISIFSIWLIIKKQTSII